MTSGRCSLFALACVIAMISCGPHSNLEGLYATSSQQVSERDHGESTPEIPAPSVNRKQQPEPDEEQIHKSQKLAPTAGQNRRKHCDFQPMPEAISSCFQISHADLHIQNTRTTTAQPPLQIVLCISLT
ncbi:hypothetical protein V6x_59960 [Gimesia chilikensis]|uniref:Uncharacterized protein n=1 Tax=Gimesia chilikensis TaxID=2605989 RepID=A0A517WLY8_9PLAN|nr:hypothetical protein V6x_59960 [Gimesia chilikensis]